MRDMQVWSVLAFIMILLGGFLVGFGIRASRTITNQVVEGFTGRYTTRTMWYLIGGALLIVIGIILLFLI